MSKPDKSQQSPFKDILETFMTSDAAEDAGIIMLAEGTIKLLKTAHLSKTHKISTAKIQEHREYCRTWINAINIKRKNVRCECCNRPLNECKYWYLPERVRG